MAHKGIQSNDCKQRLSTADRIKRTQEERVQRKIRRGKKGDKIYER